MSYSLFEGTMADMTYREIESAAEEGSVVLFPVAVIEEHGPHLCLGVDTYVAYHFCVRDGVRAADRTPGVRRRDTDRLGAGRRPGVTGA